jgi:hypothetical protein
VQILQDIITATKALKGTNKCLTLKDFREGQGMRNIRYLSDWVFHTGYIGFALRMYRRYKDVYNKEPPSEVEDFKGVE